MASATPTASVIKAAVSQNSTSNSDFINFIDHSGDFFGNALAATGVGLVYFAIATVTGAFFTFAVGFPTTVVVHVLLYWLARDWYLGVPANDPQAQFEITGWICGVSVAVTQVVMWAVLYFRYGYKSDDAWFGAMAGVAASVGIVLAVVMVLSLLFAGLRSLYRCATKNSAKPKQDVESGEDLMAEEEAKGTESGLVS
ncbi:hypothetical protein W97_06907 [Coniosporium apollinis CBS 100218]|uniref:Uncharacterized protein n=1 Tax=Coniosporium apollinis (strain CBS 100218) TaxID=1168221 RepID=R7Z0H0_CONA1|nr:uncharacterized protein W97_06907 [Coniosporium apollinis CBS 100218]EON67539.1 hypothetical protein W97_06907 [Coniosporium apollinis CBS 100218]